MHKNRKFAIILVITLMLANLFFSYNLAHYYTHRVQASHQTECLTCQLVEVILGTHNNLLLTPIVNMALFIISLIGVSVFIYRFTPATLTSLKVRLNN